MNKSYDELDAILVGVDLMSSPGQELDLSKQLLGVEWSHPNEAWAQRGWHPRSRSEGNCDREGVPAQDC